jgi:hypothetical protein
VTQKRDFQDPKIRVQDVKSSRSGTAGGGADAKRTFLYW